MLVRIIGGLRSLVDRKGPLFLLNHLVLGTLAVWLLFKVAQSSFAFEKSYFIVRVLALVCVSIFGYLSFVLGRRGNARLLLCFVATCLAAEFLMRALGSSGAGARNDVPWREPRPYFMFGGPTDGRAVTLPPAMGAGAVQLNAEGFRIEREILVPKPADEFRVFVLGGSTVVGGKPLAIPDLIEARLQAKGLPRARVYNFGVVGFVSGQELALLVHRLIDLQPDLVIAYDGGNDLIEPWYYDPRPGYPFNYVVEEEAMTALSNATGAAKTLASLARDSALVQALLGTTELYDRVAGRVNDLKRAVSYGSAQWKRSAVDTYVRNITVMCRVTRASGGLFAVFFQPVLPYSKTLDSGQTALAGGDDVIRELREQRVMTLQAVAAQLPASAVEAGCRFGDLSGLLENQPADFTDVIHVDSQANELIGLRVAEDILAWPAVRASVSER
jgi:lysophospholipase L1-like esterase